MRVCAETIYQAIYVYARGQLKLDVKNALRSGRAVASNMLSNINT